MANSSSLALILAAGQGTRMKSRRAKVMHEIANRSMIGHVLNIAKKSGFTDAAVVIAPGMDEVAGVAVGFFPDLQVFEQTEQLGTAHAVLAARELLQGYRGSVVVLYGDTPLLKSETVSAVRGVLDGDADLAVLGFEAGDPTGYGRLITNSEGNLAAVREHKDASSQEKEITLCNSGVFAFSVEILPDLLDRIGNDNAKKEYYLTDAVEIARADGLKTAVVVCAEEEVMGVNSKAQLADAEARLQARLRATAMEAGVTFVAPETVFLSIDTSFGQDVVVEPHVVFGPGVRVEDGARIRAFSHLEGASIGRNAIVGPYARLRPGADLGPDVRVGNFVEVKNATLEQGAKANHLAYVGDAHVGAGANIGAGTITCNYDGFNKYRTEIGKGVFVGSNTALVAPVSVGDGAFIGSGSVISRNVPADALVVTRGPLDQRDGWAARMRKRQERGKAATGNKK